MKSEFLKLPPDIKEQFTSLRTFRLFNRLLWARGTNPKDQSELWQLLENLVKVEANTSEGLTDLAESEVYGEIENKIKAEKLVNPIYLAKLSVQVIDTLLLKIY